MLLPSNSICFVLLTGAPAHVAKKQEFKELKS